MVEKEPLLRVMARTSDGLYVSNSVWQIICTLGLKMTERVLKKKL